MRVSCHDTEQKLLPVKREIAKNVRNWLLCGVFTGAIQCSVQRSLNTIPCLLSPALTAT